MAKTRLQEKYLSEAVKGMMDKFNYKNVMENKEVAYKAETGYTALIKRRIT